MPEAFKRHKEVIAILAVCLPLYFVRNWEGGLSGDALHYAAVAKNIADTGDWILLQDQPGVLYANKPPLMFWLIAATYKLFGVSVWAAKLWSTILATGSAVVVFLLARRLFDRHVALIAGCMSATCIYAVKSYVTVRLESAVTLAVVLAAYAVVRAIQDKQPRWLLAVGLAAGLGTMVKPVAALHVYAVAVIVLGCLHRKWLLNPNLYGSALIAAAILAPWHLAAMWLGGEEFTQIYFGREIGERMVTGRHFFDGLWKNIQALFVGGLPWTPLFIAALWPWRGRWKKFPAPLAILFAFWVVEVAVFMAWPEKRRNRYVLAAYPAMVIPAAWMLTQWLPQIAREKAPKWIAGTAIAVSIALMVLPIETHRLKKMEFVKGRYYLDEFHSGEFAPYYHPDLTTGPATSEAVWSARGASVFYLDRSLYTYQTVSELAERGVPYVFTRDNYARALEEAGWKLVVQDEGHYRLYENPELVHELGSEEYERRIGEVRSKLKAMPTRPLL